MQSFPPPAPGTGAPGSVGPQHPERRRRPVLVGTAVVMALLLAVGGTTWAVVAGIETTTSSAAGLGGSGDGGSEGSEGWAPHVAELADFVADVRGRPFLRPVPIEFLDDEEFEAAVVGESEPTEEDLDDLAVTQSQMRALGLLGPGIDLLDELDRIVGGGTLAFYDTEEERITVRGDGRGVAARVTLVHELTHAWQDQHFDLDRIDDLGLIEGANLRTLAEGDAMRVEGYYLAELSDRERREHERESRRAAEAAGQELDGVADVLLASFMSPYVLGPAFVGVLEVEGGNETVDAALQDPPDTELEMIDPAVWFRGFRVSDVDAPSVPTGAEVLDEEEFGALSWIFTVGARLDPRLALALVDVWAGDRSTTYRHDGRTCVAVAVAAIDGAGVDRWASILGSWVAEGPAGSASVEREGGGVVLRSCEAPDAPPPPDGAVTVALDFAGLRLVVFEDAYAELDIGPEEASCFAREFTDRIDPDEVGFGRPLSATENERRGAEAARACVD